MGSKRQKTRPEQYRKDGYSKTFHKNNRKWWNEREPEPVKRMKVSDNGELVENTDAPKLAAKPTKFKRLKSGHMEPGTRGDHFWKWHGL